MTSYFAYCRQIHREYVACEHRPCSRQAVHRFQQVDRVAEYGLAALIAGLAAKKLGLIATLVPFAAKFSKLDALVSLLLTTVAGCFRKRKASLPGVQGS